MSDPVSAEMANQAVQSTMGQEGVGAAEQADPTADFSDSMAQADAAMAEAQPVEEVQQVQGPQEPEAIEATSEIPTDDFVQKLLSEEANIQQMMENCLSGGELSQQEMLQMQAVIYSYSQRVDLTTKVVENATSGIKDVMNTQV